MDNAKRSKRLPSIKQDQQQLYLPPCCRLSRRGPQQCRFHWLLLVCVAQRLLSRQHMVHRLRFGLPRSRLQQSLLRLLCPPRWEYSPCQRASHAGRHHRRYRHMERSARCRQLRNHGRVVGRCHQQDRAHKDHQRDALAGHYPRAPRTGSLHRESRLCRRHQERGFRTRYRLRGTRDHAVTRHIHTLAVERQSGYQY